MGKILREKLFEKAQQQLSWDGKRILKRADGKPFTELTWSMALEVASETDLLLMEKNSEILIRRTRGGKTVVL